MSKIDTDSGGGCQKFYEICRVIWLYDVLRAQPPKRNSLFFEGGGIGSIHLAPIFWRLLEHLHAPCYPMDAWLLPVLSPCSAQIRCLTSFTAAASRSAARFERVCCLLDWGAVLDSAGFCWILCCVAYMDERECGSTTSTLVVNLPCSREILRSQQVELPVILPATERSTFCVPRYHCVTGICVRDNNRITSYTSKQNTGSTTIYNPYLESL